MDLSRRALIFLSLLFSATGQAPTVLLEPRVLTVREGESASFRCQVEGGAQNIQLEWKRSNNQPLPDNAKLGPDRSVLTLANTRPGNHGQYRCLASSPAGRGSAMATLHIKHAPKVRVTPAGPVRLQTGEQLSLECRATGRPRPTLTWKRQGSTLQLVTTETTDANTIQWPGMRPEDSGVYVCQGENTVGVTEVKVEVVVEGPPGAPVASVSAREMTVVEGHVVNMECQATGSPPPVITWSKLRAPLPWKHTVAGGVLTLTSVARQDSGQYICNATNIHGYSEAYTQMEVDSDAPVRHLPARPGEAAARRRPAGAVPRSWLAPHEVRVEPGGPAHPAAGGRRHQGRKAPHEQCQTQRRRDLQMHRHQPHRVQRGSGEGHRQSVNQHW